jgi:hypothetical protein
VWLGVDFGNMRGAQRHSGLAVFLLRSLTLSSLTCFPFHDDHGVVSLKLSKYCCSVFLLPLLVVVVVVVLGKIELKTQ